MRFTKIKLINYRQYQSLELEFPSPTDTDLHLMIAKNGIGKTTLLNALNWCLYQDEPHLGNKSKALPIINTATINQLKDEERNEGKVTVEIEASDNQDCVQYIFYRELFLAFSSDNQVTKRSSKNTVTQYSVGKTEPIIYQNERADSFIAKHIPKPIREYFFFDGEQLDDYFKEADDTRVKTSIHTISQVDLLSHVEDHIDSLIRKKQKSAGVRAPKIEPLRENVEEYTKRLKKWKEEIEHNQQIIASNDKRIGELEKQMNGVEKAPELQKRLDDLEESEKRAKIELEKTAKNIKVFLRESRIALSFYQAIQQTLAYIKEKRDEKLLPPQISSDLLNEMLERNFCKACGQNLTSEAEIRIQESLNQFKLSTSTSSVLIGIEPELKRLAIEAKNYKQKKESLFAQNINQKQLLDSLQKDYTHTKQELGQFSNPHLIQAYLQERDKLKAQRDKKLERNGILRRQAASDEKSLKEAQAKLEKALEKTETCKEIGEEIAFLQLIKTAASNARKKTMNEVKDTMQAATTEYFNRFVWKENTFDRVKLNQNYQIDLVHIDGYSCLGSCSAGERALLALAFTLAVHQVSGFDAPLFIDTPVARISDENRSNFAKVLAEVGKNKQIIMTFTPSEYSEEIEGTLENVLASKRELHTDTTESNTTLKEIG